MDVGLKGVSHISTPVCGFHGQDIKIQPRFREVWGIRGNIPVIFRWYFLPLKSTEVQPQRLGSLAELLGSLPMVGSFAIKESLGVEPLLFQIVRSQLTRCPWSAPPRTVSGISCWIQELPHGLCPVGCAERLLVLPLRCVERLYLTIGLGTSRDPQ